MKEDLAKLSKRGENRLGISAAICNKRKEKREEGEGARDGGFG